MSQPLKPQTAPETAETAPPYRRVYTWMFQAWLVMFLGVICIALVFYLASYLP